MIKSLDEQFEQAFSQKPAAVFFAPGRVNLIGEHIDYNGGLVMPCAITFGTWLLVAPNQEGNFRFKSLNFDETAVVEPAGTYQKQEKHWYNYPLGVINYLQEKGVKMTGLNMLFYGDVPIGSGLSSSASIEVVTAYGLNEFFNGGLSRLDLVKIAKRVENEFIGLNSGIMDQFAVTFGEAGKALKLDCETLDYEAVDCDLQDYVLGIINTNKPRKLAESKYNERVSECQSALSYLRKELQIQNLCDINPRDFEKHEYLIPDPVVKKRARHVIEENDRVLRAAQSLASGDLVSFGSLMYSSHNSLRNFYEVSGAELDTVVDFCLGRKDVAGARMTGAGFGGCAIALVKKGSFENFTTSITTYYTDKIGYEPSVYQSDIGDGAKSL